MKQQTIYIIRPIQIFVSFHDMGNGYTWQHYHGERELEPRIAFSLLEEEKLRREMKKEYEAKGIKVILQAETFRTGKKVFIEAIEKYKTEVGV
jgi:hypothetical protein